jgi:CheY-like chemotaxis protein
MSAHSFGRTWEIFMAEDNPVDVLTTEEALKEVTLSHRLHVVEDGQEAMDFLFRRGRHSAAIVPDLILLDLNLPRKSGIEILDEIRRHRELWGIPVVIFTTSDAECDAAASYAHQADAFVTKPYGFEEFCQTVRAIVDFWTTRAA